MTYQQGVVLALQHFLEKNANVFTQFDAGHSGDRVFDTIPEYMSQQDLLARQKSDLSDRTLPFDRLITHYSSEPGWLGGRPAREERVKRAFIGAVARGAFGLVKRNP